MSFIQAYVFTMLSTIFISFGQERGHDEGHDDGGHHHDKPVAGSDGHHAATV